MHPELLRLAAEKATGALRIGDEGAFYLTDGAVTYVECARAADLDRLVTGPGRIGPDDWRRACETGDGDIGAVIEATQGRVSRAEVEVATMIGIFDAAYFLSEPPAGPGRETAAVTAGPGEFIAGARHRLDPIWRIAPTTLDHENDRRRARLHAVWPSPAADDAPVVPVRRVRRQRVILSGLQAEILLNADGRRTPCELAAELGRPAYSCVLAVRELAAAGLIRTPASPPQHKATAQPAGGRQRSPAQRPATRSKAAQPAVAQRSTPPQPARPPRTRSQTTARRPSAPVRKKPDRAEPPPPGAAPPPPNTAGPGATPPDAGNPEPRWAPVDEALLTRLHDALKELG